MRKLATPIAWTEFEQDRLRSWLRAGTCERRTVERAQIILAAEGTGTNEIARELRTRPGRVSRWRTRFTRERLAGLSNAPRPEAAARARRERVVPMIVGKLVAGVTAVFVAMLFFGRATAAEKAVPEPAAAEAAEAAEAA